MATAAEFDVGDTGDNCQMVLGYSNSQWNVRLHQSSANHELQFF